MPARTEAIARAMWVIFLEMGLALALLVLIVWWTWPGKRSDNDPAAPPLKKKD
jgi:hypothetical protein